MISVNGIELGGSSGSVASTDITDSTSVGRSVLTATDEAAARTAIGVSGVSLGAIADLTNVVGPTNSFHLIEAAGAFVDNGSSPQTLTETGTFRRARLGPRALVPGVWSPVSPAGTYLSFPAAFGSYADLPFSVGITIRGNGESGPSGKILMAGWGASPVHEVVWVDATHVRVILHHASLGPILGPLVAVDPTKPLRILYTYVYHSPWLYVNGVGTNCGSDHSFTNNGFTDVLALIEATGFSADDLEFWGGVTLTAGQAVADYERFAQAFAVPTPMSVTASQITDSTSVGRAVLTATDAAAARTAIGVSGGGAGAIADLSNWGNPTNAFHLLEPAGAFADHGSAPQTLTVTGGFRRGRLGPRALIPAVWPPVSAVGSLSFPASTGYNGPFSVGLTIRGNGKAPAAGSILQATSGGSVRHKVFFSDPANLNARIFSTSGSVYAGTPFAINTSTSHRIVYTFAYPGGAVWMDGALGTSFYGFPNDPADMMLCLVDCAGISACDFDFWSGVVLTADEIAADFERYASSFRY